MDFWGPNKKPSTEETKQNKTKRPMHHELPPMLRERAGGWRYEMFSGHLHQTNPQDRSIPADSTNWLQ